MHPKPAERTFMQVVRSSEKKVGDHCPKWRDQDKAIDDAKRCDRRGLRDILNECAGEPDIVAVGEIEAIQAGPTAGLISGDDRF
jgi:hypothetical protein